MRLTPLRLFLTALPLLVLMGCSTTSSCEGDQEYLKAQERPKLDLPPDVTTSERVQPIAIPQSAPDPQKLDPQPRCLDYPPQYFAKKAAAPGSAEAAVRAWGAAWAGRKPDVVIQAYAPSFQTAAPGGSSAFLSAREEEVATGAAPSPQLEGLTVTNDGDRAVVAFTQVFGDTKVRRELTLAREGQAWRIVAERTLPTP